MRIEMFEEDNLFNFGERYPVFIPEDEDSWFSIEKLKEIVKEMENMNATEGLRDTYRLQPRYICLKCKRDTKAGYPNV